MREIPPYQACTRSQEAPTKPRGQSGGSWRVREELGASPSLMGMETPLYVVVVSLPTPEGTKKRQEWWQFRGWRKQGKHMSEQRVHPWVNIWWPILDDMSHPFSRRALETTWGCRGGSVDFSPFPITTIKEVLTDFSPFCCLWKDIFSPCVQEQVKTGQVAKG